ncbi:MAG: thioredoxin domain-containing protein [Rhizomicrobium sp.]
MIVLLAAAGYYLFFPANSASEAIPVSAASGPSFTITADDHTLGSPKAPITLIEYAAPTCPHCGHFNETVFPLLKQSYIDTGKVYYIFRVFPLHPPTERSRRWRTVCPKTPISSLSTRCSAISPSGTGNIR